MLLFKYFYSYVSFTNLASLQLNFLSLIINILYWSWLFKFMFFYVAALNLVNQ